MKFVANAILLLSLLVDRCSADVVLSERIMEIALMGAELSSLAYQENPPGDVYDHFGFFDSEPDQALVVQQHGYCFAAFRGTTLTWEDWKQNFEIGFKDICVDDPDGIKNCCSTRSGFYNAYFTAYRKDMEDSIRTCASSCANPDECVVMTGHSQGGAIAAVAGLIMADLNPYVITFGQPSTIDAPCELITSERWFRFVNTKAASAGISYDPIPFAPGLGADSFGHMILLGEDPTGVAYVGLDAQDVFGPIANGVEAHSMIAGEGVKFPGYLDRLQKLVNQSDTFPIRANGFAAGTLCSEGKECMSGICAAETHFTYNRCVGVECTADEECESGRCDSGTCIPKLSSCMPCDEDTDCAGGRCLLFQCSGPEALMDNNCICKWDSDCASGRCELFETGYCEAKLGVGATCNEHSDCVSDFCSWSFVCEDSSKASALNIPSSSQDKSKKRGGFGKIVLATITIFVAVFVYRRVKRRRGGYDEIGTEVIV